MTQPHAEAVRKTTERLRYTASINARRFDDDHPLVGELREAADLIEMLASTPPSPAGGVREALGELIDRVHEFGTFKLDGEDDPMAAWDDTVVPALVAARAALSSPATPDPAITVNVACRGAASIAAEQVASTKHVCIPGEPVSAPANGEAVEAGRKLADGYGIVLAMIAAGCSDPQRFAKRMLAEYEPEAKKLGITK